MNCVTLASKGRAGLKHSAGVKELSARTLSREPARHELAQEEVDEQRRVVHESDNKDFPQM